MATKYRRSQAAHRRLMEKHRDGNSIASRAKYVYHQSVAAEQSERKRILSRSEKVSFWRRAFNYIRGLHQKEKDGVMMKRARAQTARVQHTTKKKTPVFDYSEFFDFDSRGRIKGSYIDGRFEPD